MMLGKNTGTTQDNLHEMSKSIFWAKIKKNINLSSAGSVQRIVNVKGNYALMKGRLYHIFCHLNLVSNKRLTGHGSLT